VGLRVDEQHAEHVPGHEEQNDGGHDVYEHPNRHIPRFSRIDASRSTGWRYRDGQASASLRRDSRRCSGMTLMSASTGMKFVSPFQRGTTWT
jgi:hypothetical protein